MIIKHFCHDNGRSRMLSQTILLNENTRSIRMNLNMNINMSKPTHKVRHGSKQKLLNEILKNWNLNSGAN